MQMNKAILKNSETVIFEKKKFAAIWGTFFTQPAGSEIDFFFHVGPKNINILHKIKSRIGNFHDSHLPLLKFVPWL